jgi:hypothetical protein
MAQQPNIGPCPPLSSPSIRGLIPGFETLKFITVRGRQPLAQPPTWRTSVSLLVWIIPFDLSGMGGPTSSYATAGIALTVIWPHKPHHYVKVETPSGGMKVLSLGKRYPGRDSNQAPPRYKFEGVTNIVTCLLRTWIVKPAETADAWDRLSKHIRR